MNARIYQDEDQWVLWLRDIDEKLYFETESEAKEAMQKLELAKAIIWQAQRQAATMDEAPDVLQEYFDSGVTFIDADVEALGVTAAQITACLTLLENIGKFYDGDTPANAVYRTTVNAVRRVEV